MSTTYGIYRSFIQNGGLQEYGSGLYMTYWFAANVTLTSFDVKGMNDSRVATTVWFAIGK